MTALPHARPVATTSELSATSHVYRDPVQTVRR